jgi:hypothetical protein
MLPAYFCSQDCFKKNYKDHKKIHAAAKQFLESQM